MIEQKLQDKIEDTVVSALENEALNVNPGIDPVADQTEMESEQVQQPSILEPIEQPSDAEPVEVAGIGGIVQSAIEGFGKRAQEAEKRVTMEADAPPPVRELDRSLVIAPADPDEIKLINEQLGGEYVKGLNFPAIFEAGQDFDAATYLAKFKDANQELFETAKRKKITFDDMMVMAEARGLDEIVYDLLKRDPGEVMPPEDFLAGMLAYSQLFKQSRGAWDEAFNMARGPERDAALQRALQLSTVHSQVAVNLSGTVSEAARTLQLAGELQRRGVPDVVQELTLFGAKTAQDIEYVGRHYLAITDPRAMTRFLKKAANAKSLDAISEVWINSILTSPVTHMVNIAGNATYGQLRNLETFVAAGFGRLRSTITGNKDRVRAREGLAQLNGVRLALLDGLIMAGKVAVTETPSDLMSKIDVRTRRAIGTTGDPRDVLAMIRDGKIGPAAVNAFGIYARLGGRALLAEDELFKAIGGRSELYRIAAQRSDEMYDMVLDTGGTVEEARRAAALERANVINNPSEDVKRQVVDAARDLTFQGDLDGFLGQLQGAVSHPIAKLFLPFYKTPMNIMLATLERTPITGPLLLRKELMAGGRRADIAMSKIAVSSAIMASFAYSAFGLDGPEKDLIIIGNGPSDREAKAAMLRQGFQPFSINLRQEDGTYKSITYSRFDPISPVLTMAADFAYYAQYEDDTMVLEELSAAMSMGLAEVLFETPGALARAGELGIRASTEGLANYLIEMPLLQTLSEVQGALMSPDPSGKFDALLGIFGQKGTEAVMSVLPGTGSFTAGVARVEDPTARSTMLPAEGLFGDDPTTAPKFVQGFYTALQKAKSRNPFFNQDLPPRLNEWGEPIKVGKGVWWEFVSPIRIQTAQYNRLDKEMMDLGDGIPRTPKKIDGVLLNNVQYNRWIELTNQIDSFNRMPGEPGYDASDALIINMDKQLDNPMYQGLPTKADKLRVLKNIRSSKQSIARQRLLEEDSDLWFKVNSVQ